MEPIECTELAYPSSGLIDNSSDSEESIVALSSGPDMTEQQPSTSGESGKTDITKYIIGSVAKEDVSKWFYAASKDSKGNLKIKRIIRNSGGKTSGELKTRLKYDSRYLYYGAGSKGKSKPNFVLMRSLKRPRGKGKKSSKKKKKAASKKKSAPKKKRSSKKKKRSKK